jgi:hypothetical protein
MSMELWILSDKKLHSIAAWQLAIDTEGYSLELPTETSFEDLNGFLPCYLRKQLTGFECYHDDAVQFMRAHPEIDFGHSWQHVLGLRWVGSKKNELRASWIAGTAYAQATDGVVFDDQEGKIRSSAEAREVARMEYEAPEIDVRSVVDKILPNLKMGRFWET